MLPLLLLYNLTAAPAGQTYAVAAYSATAPTVPSVGPSGRAAAMSMGRAAPDVAAYALDAARSAMDEGHPAPAAAASEVTPSSEVSAVVTTSTAPETSTTTAAPTTTTTLPTTTTTVPATTVPAPTTTAAPTTTTTVPPTTTTSAPVVEASPIAPWPYKDSWPDVSMWDRLASCESGGNWAVNTGNGYFGGLQFNQTSWAWVGGEGLPHQADRAEQIYRASLLWEYQGWGAWPGCTRKFGWSSRQTNR